MKLPTPQEAYEQSRQNNERLSRKSMDELRVALAKAVAEAVGGGQMFCGVDVTFYTLATVDSAMAELARSGYDSKVMEPDARPQRMLIVSWKHVRDANDGPHCL